MTLKPAICNAVNFTNDFTRRSKFFNMDLQRQRCIIANTSTYLFFYFKPDIAPETPPTATMTAFYYNGSTTTIPEVESILLADEITYLYIFDINDFTLPTGADYFFSMEVDGYAARIFSEHCSCFDTANFPDESIFQVLSINDDATQAPATTYQTVGTFPATGFFEVSEIGRDQFGNDKVEYNYSYGRKLILSSENYIKKRFTFVNLGGYQQNLLKFLCNMNTVTINGIQYCLVSDFTEKNKDELNEICDLTADFVASEQSFMADGATEMPTNFNPDNLFTI